MSHVTCQVSHVTFQVSHVRVVFISQRIESHLIIAPPAAAGVLMPSMTPWQAEDSNIADLIWFLLIKVSTASFCWITLESVDPATIQRKY